MTNEHHIADVSKTIDHIREVTKKDELLPCPFCGCIPHLVRWGNEWDVECDSNECFIVPETALYQRQEQAIEAWNRRAVDGK